MEKTTFELINDLITATSRLLWPVLTFIALIYFRKELIKLIPRIKSWKIFGNEVEIDTQSSEEQSRKNSEELQEIETTEQIFSEVKSEVEELPKKIEAPSSSPDQKHTVDSPVKIDIKKYPHLIPLVENKALDRLEKSASFGFPIKRNIKFGDYLFDGFAMSPKGTPYFIEVKFFPLITYRNNGINTIKIVTRLKVWLSSIIPILNNFVSLHFNGERPVLFILLVINSPRDLSSVIEKVDRMRTEFNTSKSKLFVKFLSYNLNKLDIDFTKFN